MPDALRLLTGRWQRAEQRLYSVVLSDPEAYQRCVLATRRLADDLVGVTAPEALVAAFDGAVPAAVAALRAVAGPEDPATVEAVAGAGFALRQRELEASRLATERARRIADATRSGAPWVLIAENGTPALAVFGHYRRLEMHLPDGMGLYAYAEEPPGADAARFVIERLPLDPATGAVLGEPRQRWVFADIEAWLAAAAQLRRGQDEDLDRLFPAG